MQAESLDENNRISIYSLGDRVILRRQNTDYGELTLSLQAQDESSLYNIHDAIFSSVSFFYRQGQVYLRIIYYFKWFEMAKSVELLISDAVLASTHEHSLLLSMKSLSNRDIISYNARLAIYILSLFAGFTVLLFGEDFLTGNLQNLWVISSIFAFCTAVCVGLDISFTIMRRRYQKAGLHVVFPLKVPLRTPLATFFFFMCMFCILLTAVIYQFFIQPIDDYFVAFSPIAAALFFMSMMLGYNGRNIHYFYYVMRRRRRFKNL